MNTTLFCPFSKRFFLPLEHYGYILRGVVVLGCFCCPSAVVWRIPFVVVYPVERKPYFYPVVQCPQCEFVKAIEPLATHRDFSFSIMMVIWPVFRIASAHHPVPRVSELRVQRLVHYFFKSAMRPHFYVWAFVVSFQRGSFAFLSRFDFCQNILFPIGVASAPAKKIFLFLIFLHYSLDVCYAVSLFYLGHGEPSSGLFHTDMVYQKLLKVNMARQKN